MEICIICEDCIQEEEESKKLTLKDCEEINDVNILCAVNMVTNVGDKVSMIFAFLPIILY